MPPKKLTTTLRACLCWAFHSRGKQVIEPVQLLNQEKQQTMPTGAMIHGYSWHMFEAPAGCAQSSRSVFAPVQGRKGSEKTQRKVSIRRPNATDATDTRMDKKSIENLDTDTVSTPNNRSRSGTGMTCHENEMFSSKEHRIEFH